jgi:hypothetical protein
MESKTSFKEHETRQLQLLNGYPELHLSPSLDQSYYMGLIDTHIRDADQVLTKALDLQLAGIQEDEQDKTLPFELINMVTTNATAPALQTAPNPPSSPVSQTGSNGDNSESKKVDQSRLLLVPQFWLWRVDERKFLADLSLLAIRGSTDSGILVGTIITTCPERLHGGDESANQTLYKSLKRGLDAIHKQRKSISLESFMAFVVQDCIGFFNDPCNSGLNDPASLMFARYTALQV